MRFVVDVNLPRPLIKIIRQHGHVADYATDHVAATVDDIAIWALAVRLAAAIVTKDEDFINLAARRPERVRVVWLRCGNIYNPDLYALIQRHLPAIVAAFDAGQQVIEIR